MPNGTGDHAGNGSDPDVLLRIGELAGATGVSVRSLRYYEAQGLLPAVRDASGYRRYRPDAGARVAHIQLLFAAGLCSSKIADLLAHIDGDEREIRVSADLAGELEAARQRLRRQLDGVTSAIGLLDRLLDASRAGTAAALPHDRAPMEVRGALEDRVNLRTREAR